MTSDTPPEALPEPLTSDPLPESPPEALAEPLSNADEIDGYAAGAVACAFASFLVPVVLAVAALTLARASEVRREQLGLPVDGAVRSPNDTVVWVARIVAWANIVLVGALLLFLLVGIAARVLS